MLNEILNSLETTQEHQAELETFRSNAIKVFSDGAYDGRNKVLWLFQKADGKLTRNKFYRIKRLAKALYNGLYDKGLVVAETVSFVENISHSDIDMETEISGYYFASIDDILGFIDEVSIAANIDDDSPQNIKAIVILSWFGFSREDMIKIKKADLHSYDSTIVFGNFKAVLPPHIFEVLSQYASADYCVGKNGRMYGYMDSPYLFRSRKSIQMNARSVSSTVARFNDVASEHFINKIKLQAVSMNGIFFAMVEDGVVECDQETAARYFPFAENGQLVYYRVMYDKWRATYY